MSGPVDDADGRAERVERAGDASGSGSASPVASPHVRSVSEEMKGIDLGVAGGPFPPRRAPSLSAARASSTPRLAPSPASPAAARSAPAAAAKRKSRSPWALVRRMTSRLINDAAPLSFSLNDASDPALSVFPSNVIRTSKYSLLTFLPLNLFEQFRRLANQYFLFIVLIQLIPNVSPFPIYTSVAPLVFILAVSAASEAREDTVRHRADALANSRSTVRVSERGEEQPMTSSDVRVGDILKVGKGEEFPADLILLSSSREDHTAYVNTANLDGEAAPKVRIAPTATSEATDSAAVAALRGRIKYEQPSTSLYRFQGQVLLDPADGSGDRSQASRSRPPTSASATFGVGDKQLLLRGSRLINTDFVYGLVVYTGAQTKMMLNRNPAQLKFSRYEQGLNRLVIVVLLINFLVCLLLSLYYVGVNQDWPCEFDLCATDGSQWLLGFLTNYILFSFMIPQSLYVTMQLVKIGQALFMQWDNAMGYTDPDTGEYRTASVKSNSLNEELGHIDAICTDKTGTLTQNRMQLSKVSVDCRLFFQSKERREDSLASTNGRRPPPPLFMSDLVHSAFAHVLTADDADEGRGDEEGKDAAEEDAAEEETVAQEAAHVDGFHTPVKRRRRADEAVEEDGRSPGDGRSSSALGSPSSRRPSLAAASALHLDFVLNLLLCNAVLPDLQASEDGSTQRLLFQSQSPDEIALVEALHEAGVTLLARSGPNVTVRVALPGFRVYTAMYEVLAVLEFSSTWRRMSAVVRLPDGSVRLYVKGADSTIAALTEQGSAEQRRALETTMGHVTDFATTGSRTLVMAGRPLSDAEFTRWFDAQYHPAETALEDRDNAIERAFRLLESRLTLLGASAVDDQLQEFVPQAVDFLLKADIKIVVLTGDKLETAVTVAKQSHLIMPQMRVLYVQGVKKDEVEAALRMADAHIAAELEHSRAGVAASAASASGGGEVRFALAIDGVCLELALLHCSAQFLSIFTRCDTIVSYRSTPLQKALVVRMCKLELGLTTLAIGDGANDCISPETPVAMADGAVKLARDVVQGDRLLGTGGRSALVTSVPFTRAEGRMYRITARSGDELVVSPGHLVTLAWRRRTSLLNTMTGGYRAVRLVMWRSDTLQPVSQSLRFRLRGESAPALPPNVQESVVYASYEEALAAYRKWLADNNRHDGYVDTYWQEDAGRIVASIHRDASSRSERLLASSFSWVITGRAWTPEPILVDSVADARQYAWSWYSRAFAIDTEEEDTGTAVATPIDSAVDEELELEGTERADVLEGPDTPSKPTTPSTPTSQYGYTEEARAQRLQPCTKAAGAPVETMNRTQLPDSLPHMHVHWSVLSPEQRGWRPLQHGDLVEVRAEELAKPNVLKQLGPHSTATASVALVLSALPTTTPSASSPVAGQRSAGAGALAVPQSAVLRLARAVAGSGDASPGSLQLMTADNAFRPLVATDRARLGLFLHNPLTADSLHNANGQEALTIRQLRLALNTLSSSPITVGDGIFVTPMCKASMQLALATGASALVVFGHAARRLWRAHAGELPGVARCSYGFSDVDQVWSTWLVMEDGRRVRVVHSPHPCLSNKLLEVVLAIRAARVHLGFPHPALSDAAFAALEQSSCNHFSDVMSIVHEPTATRCTGWQVDGDGRFVLGNGILTHNCSMIQEAHVGVGVLGKEGAHAAMSSDFVIHRFHHLVRLLCLHGRWCYWRSTQVVFFSFYKNFVFPLPLFWFQFWAMGSGTNMYDSLLVTLFNTFFTSIPPFMVGISDKDVQDELLLEYPQAYAAFKRDNPLTVFGFVYMLLSAVYQSVVVFFLIYGVFAVTNVIGDSGRGEGMYVMGDIAITAVVLITNLYMLVNVAAVTALNWLALVVGLLLYACTFIFMSASWEPSLSPQGYGIATPVFGTLTTWLYFLLVIVLALGPTQTLLCYWRLTRPLAYQALQLMRVRRQPKNQQYHRQKSVKAVLQKQNSINIHHDRAHSGTASPITGSARRLSGRGPPEGTTPPTETPRGSASGRPSLVVATRLQDAATAQPQPQLASSPPPSSPALSDDGGGGRASLVPSSAFLSSTLSPHPPAAEAELQRALSSPQPPSSIELQQHVAHLPHSTASASSARRLSAQRKAALVEEHKHAEDE